MNLHRTFIKFLTIGFCLTGEMIYAQEFAPFVEFEAMVDNSDTLIIFKDGSWTYDSDGRPPFGLGSGITNGINFEMMENFNNFPTPESLGQQLENWDIKILLGEPPRCPEVGQGSNPSQAASVIEHRSDYVKMQFNDYGNCKSGGRVNFFARLSYVAFLPFSISVQPQGTNVVVGDTLKLSVESNITGLHYQWRHDYKPIVEANSSELKLENVSQATRGLYDVIVSDWSGSLASQAAFVEVRQEAPVLIIESFPSFLLLMWPFDVAAKRYQIFSGTDVSLMEVDDRPLMHDPDYVSAIIPNNEASRFFKVEAIY